MDSVRLDLAVYSTMLDRIVNHFSLEPTLRGHRSERNDRNALPRAALITNIHE